MKEDEKNQSKAGNRRLQVAVSTLIESWFPANAKLLQLIQANLSKGQYNNNKRELIADLRKDCSLFLYCIKKLVTLIGISDEAKLSGIDPEELLNRADLEEFKQILAASIQEISFHSYGDMSEGRATRFHETIVSSATAVALSSSQGVTPDLAFSCALLRQLGLTLIAWNYPHVYDSVINSLKPDTSLDSALGRILGYSPTLLGIAIAKQWNLNPQILRGMGERTTSDSHDSEEKLLQKGDALAKICRIGESLARASSSLNYPESRKDWNKARAEIEAALGQEGFHALLTKISESSKTISANLPFSTDYLEISNAIAPINTGQNSSQHAADSNAFLRKCDQGVSEELTKLYGGFDRTSISKELIEQLVRLVMPKAGFNRGCIYLIEPETMVLVPRLSVGKSKLSDFKAIKCNPAHAALEPAIAAFNSKYPLIEVTQRDGMEKSYIASCLGVTQKAGVLYVELDSPVAEESLITDFRAVHQALSDFLTLN